jgi:hypothetical protein
MGQSWRAFNVKPATSSFWDINKVKLTNGKLTFPIQEFLSPSTGSFAVYLLNNHNTDITDMTLSSQMSWTPGTYETRSDPANGAYVRFEFQDVTSGPITSSDYWWSSVSLDLNASLHGASLTAALANRSLWTNICGQSATDPTVYAGPNCVGTTDPAVSPYDGFTNAMKNVKQLGLSFGSASRYASGVARNLDPGIFSVSSFDVTP